MRLSYAGTVDAGISVIRARSSGRTESLRPCTTSTTIRKKSAISARRYGILAWEGNDEKAVIGRGALRLCLRGGQNRGIGECDGPQRSRPLRGMAGQQRHLVMGQR